MILLNTLFKDISINNITTDIITAVILILAEYKNTIAKIKIKSFTTAKDNKNIFKFELSFNLKTFALLLALTTKITVTVVSKMPSKHLLLCYFLFSFII